MVGQSSNPAPGEWRNQLLSRQAELRAALAQREQGAATVELDQARQGRLSRMDAMQGQAMEQAAAARARSELARIAAALRRLDAGEYGDCGQCGEAIPPARLRIDPAVELCVRCAQLCEAG